MISRRSLLLAASASAWMRPRRLRAAGNGTLPVSYYVTRHQALKFSMMFSWGMPVFANTQDISSNYTLSPNTFAPAATNFIDQWVTACQSAKAKAATLVTKTEDGFCLWNTATTAHSIMNSAPFQAKYPGLDILGSFCAKMRGAGIQPFIYWIDVDGYYNNVINPGATQAQFRTYNQSQINELLTNYGEIWEFHADATLWNYNSYYPWTLPYDMAAYVHSIQQNTLVLNNSHRHTTDDSDVVNYEAGGIPAGNTIQAEENQSIFANGTWYAHNPAASLRTSAGILNNLANTNALNANYQLSVSPDTSGLLPSNVMTTLAAVGAGQ